MSSAPGPAACFACWQKEGLLPPPRHTDGGLPEVYTHATCLISTSEGDHSDSETEEASSLGLGISSDFHAGLNCRKRPAPAGQENLIPGNKFCLGFGKGTDFHEDLDLGFGKQDDESKQATAARNATRMWLLGGSGRFERHLCASHHSALEHQPKRVRRSYTDHLPEAVWFATRSTSHQVISLLLLNSLLET